MKPIHFASDAAGFGRFQRYLDRHSSEPRDFLILLEPTGSYGLTVLLYLLGKGYRVRQVENRAVKDYREKIFGSETKTDDTAIAGSTTAAVVPLSTGRIATT